MNTTTPARLALRGAHARRRASNAANRNAAPRLLAYSVRRLPETAGCGQYYTNSCGINAQWKTGGGCGQNYTRSCGDNQAWS